MIDEAERRADILNERRVQLYLRVGAVTVAGGRAESALQRLAHVVSGGSRWNNANSTVPVDWGRLNKHLRKTVATEPEDDVMRRIGAVLDWATSKNLWVSRNNIIHAAWHEPPSGPLSGLRLYRNGETATIIATYEDLDQLASDLSELTQRLHALLDEITPGQHPVVQWVWPEGL